MKDMTPKNERTHPEEPIVCPLCGHSIQRNLLQTHVVAEEYVLERIRHEHPDWVEENGACTKCWEDYLGLDARIRPLRSAGNGEKDPR